MRWWSPQGRIGAGGVYRDNFRVSRSFPKSPRKENRRRKKKALSRVGRSFKRNVREGATQRSAFLLKLLKEGKREERQLKLLPSRLARE
ncbi:hypothetical protein NXF25_019793 [Crotalus adamanteus]|uniref:Uncharacterized protein n=1 Tax=Crotalus adamanteus TaxID=8729 RepID=A0AAW1B4P4_CROAD